jgi:hypothetical protein
LANGHRLFAHGLASLVVEEGARRLFDHLLVSTLDRALTLPQIHAVAVTITQYLDLDVAGLFNKLFDEDAVVTEAVTRFVATGSEAIESFFIIPSYAQAFTTAAGAGLDHYGVPNTLCNLDRFLS